MNFHFYLLNIDILITINVIELKFPMFVFEVLIKRGVVQIIDIESRSWFVFYTFILLFSYSIGLKPGLNPNVATVFLSFGSKEYMVKSVCAM